MKKIINIYKKYKEIIKYIIVGACTTVVSLISYYIAVLFLNPNNPIELQIANMISWILSVSFAYLANRTIVFKSKENNKIKESIKFFVSRLSTLFIDMITMFLLVSVFQFNDKISKILVQFIVLILNYVFSKLFVFNTKKNI